MPEYIVSVMPPKDEDAEPFDIPEWEFDAAIATAERYRERGWKACVISCDYTSFQREDKPCAISSTPC